MSGTTESKYGILKNKTQGGRRDGTMKVRLSRRTKLSLFIYDESESQWNEESSQSELLMVMTGNSVRD